MSSGGGAEGDGGGGGLAPGFRFHPTDEELVAYYLKRKVSGRPFRVDAISEIDLYKAEPWDLPGKSRIRSRDAEWYFFSPLDRKYANRSRTNRATAAGYWKTTGKDRPVHRSSAAAGPPIGMKKTLVFHLGRAPSGCRTNWVMHEYRLLDPQEGFVVCRIFQKRGPGPQNGAQYGAPLVEEDEWEECESVVVKEESADGDLITDQDVEDQKAVRQELSNSLDGALCGNEADETKSNVILKDGCLDLDDFASSPGEIIHNYEDHGREDLTYVNEYLADDDDHDGGDMFKDFTETGETADDGIVYFDATSDYPDESHVSSSSSGINSFLDSTIGIEGGPDPLDEMMAYLDATENLKLSDLDNGSGPSSSPPSNPSCPAPAVNSSPSSSSDEAGCSGSSPSSTSSAGKQSSSHVVDFHGGSDLPSSDIWEKALSKHLFNMLDVISPPPAFGDGQPIKGSHSTARASNSIRITAGIIQIYGGVVPGSGKNWSVQKNVGVSIVLSYTEASMPKSAESFIARGFFQLLFFSVLILTASFKIGLRMLTR